MCRLLGIVSSEPTAFRILLRESPRSLAVLSEEHPDGWGIAVHNDSHADGFRIQKQARCAKLDEMFHEHALEARGTTLVAHIRKKTVGPTSIDNTHPFRRGRWVFAHNGTVKDTTHLRGHTSAERLAEVRGDTDSELLFAHVLTALDRAEAHEPDARARADHALMRATSELRDRADLGTFNFLLSDGEVTYAHRFGRSLFILERRPHDPSSIRRIQTDGPDSEPPKSERRHAVFVASEKITNEAWHELPEGTLMRIDRAPRPSWRTLAG
jgi:predicted glutamine amidotransferase